MVTRWEKRDKKLSTKKKTKSLGKIFADGEESYSFKKKHKKKKRTKDGYYREYINEKDY